MIEPLPPRRASLISVVNARVRPAFQTLDLGYPLPRGPGDGSQIDQGLQRRATSYDIFEM